MDFVEFGSRDPFNYIDYAKSYPSFLQRWMGIPVELTPDHLAKMEYFSKEVCNGQRIEDILLLKGVMERGSLPLRDIQEELSNSYQIKTESEHFHGILDYINGEFFNKSNKESYGLEGKDFLFIDGDTIQGSPYFEELLRNQSFYDYLSDLIKVAKGAFDKKYNHGKYSGGFILYEKYSRKDVCRILQWKKDESAVMFGYKVKYGTCPAFITYQKGEGVSKSTQYQDLFFNQERFHWMSKNRRTLKSKDIKAINGDFGPIRIPFFVKKSDDEGQDFYYLGDVKPYQFLEQTIKNEKGKDLPIVNINVAFTQSIDDNVYDYFTEGGTIKVSTDQDNK